MKKNFLFFILITLNLFLSENNCFAKGTWSAGPSFGLLYWGPGIDVTYQVDSDFSVGINGGAFFMGAAEGYGRYYFPVMSKQFGPYVGVGITYWEPNLLDNLVSVATSAKDSAVTVTNNALNEVYFGKLVSEPDLDSLAEPFENSTHWLGPSLRIGIDIPLLKRFIFNFEAGGAYLKELKNRGYYLAPNGIAALKYLF